MSYCKHLTSLTEDLWQCEKDKSIWDKDANDCQDIKSGCSDYEADD